MAKEAVKGKPAKSGLRLFLGRFLRWLVEPAAGVAEKDRQKMRLLSAFLLVVTINAIWGSVVRQGLDIGTWINLLALTVVFAVAYGLSRTRYYKPALIVALLAPAFYIIGMVVTASTDSAVIILSLGWLVLPFLLASLFLSRRATLFVAIGYFVFMGSIFPFTTLSIEFMGEVIAFSLMVVFLVIAIAFIRQRDQSRVEKELIKRAEAEEGLRVNEERFRLLADNASDMIIRFQLSPTFKTDYVSPSSERVIGYKPEEFYADPELGLKAIHPEDRKPFLEYVSLKNLDHRPITLRMVRKGGTIIWTEQTFTTIHDHNGKPVAVQAISRDVTERKLMEEEIQAEKNKLQSLIGAMDCTLTIQDRDFNVIYQNEPSKLASGGDHIGEKCYRVYEGRDSICVGCPVAKAFKDGKSHTSERRRLEPSGEITFWENTANPIRDAEGNIVSCVEVARDITERKKAEQALADEATRRHILVDQSLDGIVVLDEDAKVVEANQKFAETLGYTPEEVRELHTWDWDKQYPPEKLLEMGRNVDEKGLNLETKHHRKDGSVIDVEISINGATVAGRKLIFCVSRDVTERRRMEKALRESEEKFFKAFRSSPNAMALTTLKEGRFLEVNNGFLRLNGLSREEVIGRTSKELGVWVNRKDRVRILRIMREKGGVVDEEYKSRTKSGEIRTMLFSAEPIDIAGESCMISSTTDITERKRIGQALRKSEEKFSKAFSSSPDAMAISTIEEGRFLEVNGSFLRDYGYSREEVIGHSSKELGTWFEPKARDRILKTLRDKGRVFDAEFEARIRSGEIRTMTFSAELIEIEGERCIIASTKDITERKQMEEALRESEEKYKTLTEDAPLGIYFSDFRGTFLYGNKRAEEIVGYKHKELLGKSFLQLKLIGPKELGRAIKLLALNKLGRATGPDRFVLNRKDGTKTSVEIRTRIATVGGRKVVLGMVEDITEREKAESAIKYQRELIDQIIATTPNAVMVIDKDMKVLLANDTFYNKFGLKKSGVENKPIAKIIKDEELAQHIESAVKNKKSLSFEFRYELKGAPRIFITTITEMQNKRYLILLDDVTEEREKQERLYLTDRLASVGEMASGVAHELNNPLTSIIGLSSLMAQENDIPAETRADLTAINSEAQRCAAIVKNLLAFARKHTPRREPLLVDKIVEDVLKLRAYEHHGHNVTVETDFTSDLPEVLGDYFQLQQVFLNIILNAETAMVDTSGGGTLRITAERTDGNVRVSFSDDGPGIAKKDLSLIFNPFFTTKAVGKGTGLGLSIAYGIISAHGGKIYAKNNNDKGATFIVELPVVDN
jgi:PAS domain S-box-containing protein